jgi:hypothetical protein
MTNGPSAIQSMIEDLEKDLAEAERHANDLRGAIGVLRTKAGLPPRPDGGGHGRSAPTSAPSHISAPAGTPTVIKHDTFFNKKMGSAARIFLEMRYETAKGTSPAKPREIFDALKQGGFVFDTKDDTVAMVSLRSTLRKNTQMFQKLPNGTYGLRSWYPGSKPPRSRPADADDHDMAKGVTGDDLRAASVIPQHAKLVGEK